MLGPGPVSMVVLSQHCAECSPKEYDDITLIFSQQFSLHFHLSRPPFHRETLQTILPYPFLSRFLQTHHSLLTFQGFLAFTATPFLPRIFSLFLWPLPPVVVWSLQQSFLLTLPYKKMHLGPCSLLPPATVSPGHSSQAQVLSCSLSVFHFQKSNPKNSDFPAHITWISLWLLLRVFTFFRTEIPTALSWVHFHHSSFLPTWPASEAWNTCQQLNHDSVSQ